MHYLISTNLFQMFLVLSKLNDTQIKKKLLTILYRSVSVICLGR
jgi:hypothetical protein